MKVFGIIGWKNSGKTTLICRLVAHFKAQGLSVSTVKHSHHDIEFDQPGKDSFQHRQSGASEVMLVSRNRWALFNEMNSEEPDVDALLNKMSPVDVLLIEGFKQHKHPKIQVYREEMGNPRLLIHDIPDVIAIASDACIAAEPGLPENLQRLDLNDVHSIGEFILAHSG